MMFGDWPSILSPKGIVPVLDGSPETTALYVVIRIVAFSMRLQAQGDVIEAWKQLAIATERLAPIMFRWVAGEPQAVVTPAPTSEIGMMYRTWLVSLVIWREQQELLSLRSFFGTSGRTRREQLVAAVVEYMRWVADDPWAGRRARADRIPVEATRANICARANQLARFANPTARDLRDVAGWKGAGGYSGLYEMALEMVAEGAAEPWTSRNPATADLSVREGRRLVWERATR